MENDDYYVYVYLNQLKEGLWVYKEHEFKYQPFYVGKGRCKREVVHLCNSMLKIKFINMTDSLGNRMKDNFENRFKSYLPRRTYTLIRIDGKAFHTYTKGLVRPFDDGLVSDMDETAIYLCNNIQGAKFAFVQSDEISILLTDFESITTDAWFDGNIQKIVSISSSLATAKFNQLRSKRFIVEKYNRGISNITSNWFDDLNKLKLASFDSRVFIITDPTEVENYFIWRQQDTVRNSISSLGQSLYSHKELMGKNISQIQEMCFQKGINWNDIDPKLRRGRLIKNESCSKTFSARSRWISVAPPIFTQERDIFNLLIPKII